MGDIAGGRLRKRPVRFCAETLLEDTTRAGGVEIVKYARI